MSSIYIPYPNPEEEEEQFQVIPRSHKNYLHWITPSELEVILSSRFVPSHAIATLLHLNRTNSLYSTPDRHLKQYLNLGSNEYLKLMQDILKEWELRVENAQGQAPSHRPSREIEERATAAKMWEKQGIYTATDPKHKQEAYEQQVSDYFSRGDHKK